MNARALEDYSQKPGEPRCLGITTYYSPGSPCSRPRTPGRDYCWQHKAPTPPVLEEPACDEWMKKTASRLRSPGRYHAGELRNEIINALAESAQRERHACHEAVDGRRLISAHIGPLFNAGWNGAIKEAKATIEARGEMLKP